MNIDCDINYKNMFLGIVTKAFTKIKLMKECESKWCDKEVGVGVRGRR